MANQNRVQRALLVSFAVSLLSFSVKIAGFIVTGSTVALSDAAESVVHLFAVAFVVYGFYLSLKPPDDDHHYGHERIEFLSVGAEGAVIIIAGISILYHALREAITGARIENAETGMLLMAIAAVINLILGLYVLKVGREEKNMIAISNGKHTLTDVWTSGGVVVTLLVISLTGWFFLDTVVSLFIAGYIMFEAYKLLKYSILGLMDTRQPDIDEAVTKTLEDLPGQIKGWHNLRHRTSGSTTWLELHLVFDDDISLEEAHSDATLLERKLIDALPTDAVVTVHLEPEEAHDEAHDILEGANKTKKLDEFT